MKITPIQESGFTLDEVIDLIHKSFEERLEQGIVMNPSSYTTESYQEEFPDAVTLVCVDKDQLAGMIAFGIKPGYGSLYVIASGSDYKRQGVGSALFQKMEQILKEHDCEYIISDTSIHAKSSVKWHAKMGFRKVSLTSYKSTKYYSYMFRKDLTPSRKKNLRYALEFIISCPRTVFYWKKNGKPRFHRK